MKISITLVAIDNQGRRMGLLVDGNGPWIAFNPENTDYAETFWPSSFEQIEYIDRDRKRRMVLLPDGGEPITS